MIFNLFPYSPFQHYQITAYCTYSPRARYYHPTLSIWLSVDPMADKYPGVSPYTYCGNNPVRLVDSNGMEITDPPKMLKQGIQKFKTILNNLDVKVRGTVGNYEWEGHSDGANRGTITQQDVIVGTAVIGTLTGIGAIAEGGLTLFDGLALLSSMDDIFTNSKGESGLQQSLKNYNTFKVGLGLGKSTISFFSGQASVIKGTKMNGTFQIIGGSNNMFSSGYNFHNTIHYHNVSKK